MMYIGGATCSPNHAVVSSTSADIQPSLPQENSNITQHDDSKTAVMDDTNDHTYACSLNDPKITESQVSNLLVTKIDEIASKVSGESSQESSADEDDIERQIAENVLQHDSSVADEPTETAINHPEMLDLSMPKIETEEVHLAQQIPLNLTITQKCDALESGLVFVETLNSSKSTYDSIEVSPVITLSKSLPPNCENVTSHPVPKLPNEVNESLPNLHVNVVPNFKQ